MIMNSLESQKVEKLAYLIYLCGPIVLKKIFDSIETGQSNSKSKMDCIRSCIHVAYDGKLLGISVLCIDFYLF